MKNSNCFKRFTTLLTVLCFVLTQNTTVVFAADAVTQGDNGAFVPVKSLDQAQAEKPQPKPGVDDQALIFESESPIKPVTKPIIRPIDSIKPPVVSSQQQQVAGQLGVKPSDISNFVYTASPEESVNRKCKGPGCQVSVGYVSFQVNGVSYVGRIQNDTGINPPSLQTHLIETNLNVEDVRAIANNLGVGFNQIQRIESKLLPTKVCVRAPCPLASYDLKVDVLNKGGATVTSYTGTMNKYAFQKGGLPAYKIALLPTGNLPVGVYEQIRALRKELGKGFDISATRQRDGTYLITVKDNKVYPAVMPDPKVGGLQEMSFSVNSKGQPLADAKHPIKVSYYGFQNLDTALLVGAVQSLFAGLKASSAVILAKEVAMLATLKISSIDRDGTIHFKTKDGEYYKAYRNSKGAPVAEKEPSPEVRAYVANLQAAFGNNYVVSASSEEPYRISVNLGSRSCTAPGVCRDVAVMPQAGQLTHMDFVISKDGKPDMSTLQVNYAGIEKINDAGLLFDSMMRLQDPCFGQPVCQTMVKPNPDPVKAFAMMSQITVGSVDANGTIHFVKDGVNYKTYRDSKENTVLEKENLIPAVVQDTVNQLVAGMQPKNFSYTMKDLGNGSYAVLLLNEGTCPKGSVCVWNGISNGDLTSMSFNISADGVIDTGELQVSYQGVEGVDAQILLSAVKQLLDRSERNDAPVKPGNGRPIPTKPINSIRPPVKMNTTSQLLMTMSQVKVKEVNADGSIKFSLGDTTYKTFRGPDEQVVVQVLERVERDTNGNVIHRVSYDYDARGQVTQTLDVQYDSAGNPTHALQTMNNNEDGGALTTGTVETTYFPGTDKVQSLRTNIEITLPPDAEIPFPITITINRFEEYNQDGALIHNVAYDDFDRPATENFYDNGGHLIRQIAYDYDAAGSQTRLVDTTYDAAGNPLVKTETMNHYLMLKDEITELYQTGTIVTTYFPGTDKEKSIRSNYTYEGTATLPPGGIIPIEVVIPVSGGINDFREFNEAGVQIHAIDFLVDDQPASENFYDNAGRLARQLAYDNEGRLESETTYQYVLSVDVYRDASNYFISQQRWDELDQLNRADRDKGSEYSIQTGPNGEMTWTWRSANDPATTYHLEKTTVNGKDEWNMVSQTIIIPPYNLLPVSPVNVYLSAAQNLPPEQLAQLNAAMQDVGANSDFSESWTDQGDHFWNWSSADGKTTYILATYAAVSLSPDGTATQSSSWNFGAQTQVSREEVLQQAGQLTGDQLAQFQSIIANLPADTVFNKIVSGSDVSYSWSGVDESENLPAVYMISIVKNEMRFSIQMEVPRQDVVNLSQGVDAVNQRLQLAPSGSTVTISGEGILSGSALTIPAGVTLVVPDTVTLQIGELHVDGTLKADNLKLIDTMILIGDGGQIQTESFSNYFHAISTELDTGGQTFSGIISNPVAGSISVSEQVGAISTVVTTRAVTSSVSTEPEFPAAVQQAKDVFEAQGYTVIPNVADNGDYFVVVLDTRTYENQPISGAYQLSFMVRADGSIDFKGVNDSGIFYKEGGTISIDQALLFEAMMQIQDPCFGGKICLATAKKKADPQKALLMMARAAVMGINSDDDSIDFSIDGRTYWIGGEGKAQATSPQRLKSTLALDPDSYNSGTLEVLSDGRITLTLDGEVLEGQYDPHTMTAKFSHDIFRDEISGVTYADFDAFTFTFNQKHGVFYVENMEMKEVSLPYQEGWVWEAHYDSSGVLDPNRFYEAQIILSGNGAAVQYQGNPPVPLVEDRAGNDIPAGIAILNDFLNPQPTSELMQTIRDYLGVTE